MKQLCYECDLHEAVLSLGQSHPKPRSATATLAWGYKPGASTRLSYPQRQAYFKLFTLSLVEAAQRRQGPKKKRGSRRASPVSGRSRTVLRVYVDLLISSP